MSVHEYDDITVRVANRLKSIRACRRVVGRAWKGLASLNEDEILGTNYTV